jgi:hypothetical protein
MLRAFFDDSNIRQGPVYVLAGWVAPAEKWTPFANDWQAVLDMRPRVSYFKYSEAMNLSGEFLGISEPSRDEKLKLLVGILEEYGVVGISASVPHKVFAGWFCRAPAPFNNPYLMLLYGVAGRLLRYARSIDYTDTVDLIFDTQLDQVDKVMDAWSGFVRNAPDELRPLIGDPPIFRDDKKTLPLQAADLHAGWLREMNTALELGREVPTPPWHPRGGNIRREYNFMEWWHAQDTFERIFGYKPITYTFGENTELSAPPRLHLPAWPLL